MMVVDRLRVRYVSVVVLVGFFVQLAAPLAAQTADNPAQAVARATRLMREKGWTPKNEVIRQVVSPGVRTIGDNGQASDGYIVIEWHSWDDGNPYNWSGVVTLHGPLGDVRSFVQTVNFDDPMHPVILYQAKVYDYDPPPRPRRVQAREPCPTCPQVGTAVPVTNRYPDFQSFYACSAMGCGIIALVSFIPGLGAAMFFGGCTVAILRCAFGRLWRWQDTPPGGGTLP